MSPLVLGLALVVGEAGVGGSRTPAGPLQGTVLDGQGRPVGAAEVTAEAEAPPAVHALTAADGRFVLEVPAGAVSLRVRAPGFAEERRPLPAASPIVVVLRPEGHAERVTVTATGVPSRLSDTPASVVVLGAPAREATAAPNLDDALRQVVGFSLFRRTGGRTANPTAQGVSLRGLGASGASRAVVIVDGQPLNDPFGGWVYWARVPRDSIESVEVLRGGASDLYGSAALGGVVQVVTRPLASAGPLRGEASAGSQGTLDGSVALEGRSAAWGGRLSAAGFRTDGYVPVEEESRGRADSRASSSHGALEARGERSWEGRGRVHLRGGLFGESRDNGTALQTNATHVREGALGGEWSSPRAGAFRLRLDLESQVFNQSFSAVTPDRDEETVTRRQRVPARTAGLALGWSRPVGGRHVLVAGLDLRHVKGASDELAHVAGVPTATVNAGGRTRTAGLFAEELFQASPRLLLTAALRLDQWRHEDGFTRTTPLAGTAASRTEFPDRSESALSPRASVLFRATSRLSLTAAGYGAFRGPTLNELYRSFRVGDTLTLANEGLEAERLWGGEAGIRWTGERVSARATAFSSEVRDPVANVTLTVRPELTTRQRQNLGRTRSRGAEAEVEARPLPGLDLAIGYAFTDARVRSFPPAPALEGRHLPLVPRHQLTFQARYERPSGLRLAIQGRWSGAQYDDDRNLLRLAPAFGLDLRAGHLLGRGLEAFLAVENLLDDRAEVGLTPVRTLGPPLTARAGLRLRLAGR